MLAQQPGVWGGYFPHLTHIPQSGCRICIKARSVLAKVWAKKVFPEPVDPIIKMCLTSANPHLSGLATRVSREINTLVVIVYSQRLSNDPDQSHSGLDIEEFDWFCIFRQVCQNSLGQLLPNDFWANSTHSLQIKALFPAIIFLYFCCHKMSNNHHIIFSYL